MIRQKQSISELAYLGGPRLFDSPRMTGQLSAPEMTAYLGSVRRVYKTKEDVVRQLEETLARRHQVEHCITLTNACVGLMLLLALNKTFRKDKVLLPSFSYRGLPHLVRWAQQIPVFCDVEPVGHTLCPDSVGRMIGDSTASILTVHNVCALANVQQLQILAERHGAQLVIDSVYALDSSLAGTPVGSFGQAEVFSLHATKLLHGFEGGYVTTNDAVLAEKLRKLRNGQSVSRKGQAALSGLPAHLHPLHAACALLSLSRLDETKARNARRYRHYLSRFSGIPAISFAALTNGSTNHALVLLKIGEEFPFSRNELVPLLRAENALVRPYYDPPLHVSSAQPGDRVDACMNVTNTVRHQFLQMPVGEFVNLEDIDALAAFLRFLGENAGRLRSALSTKAINSPNHKQRVRCR